MLELSDDEPDTAEPPPAPTTAELPKKQDKQIRRKQEPAAAAEPDAEEAVVIGKRRKRAWEEDPGESRLAMLNRLKAPLLCLHRSRRNSISAAIQYPAFGEMQPHSHHAARILPFL